MRRILLVSLLVVAAGLSFAAATAGPANAKPTMTIQIDPTARLIAKGAAVQVRVVYACSAAPSPSLFTTITEQVSGGRAAPGGASPETLRCDGKKHALQLSAVTGNPVAFAKGTAFAQGGITSCDAAFNCITVPVSRTISIK